MKVLFAASECAPYAKVGGLGDVASALPKELERQGVSVDIVLPLYEPLFKESLTQHIVSSADGNSFIVHFLGQEEKCRLFYIQIPNTEIKLFLIQNDKYLSNGGIYLSASAFAEGDEELARFMFFSKAVFTLMERNVFEYDVIHANDYHTSYLLYLIKSEKALGKKVRLILTIHNAANQGIIESEALNLEINGNNLEHNLLGMGIASADTIVPVSPTYAKELQSGKFGFGLEPVFRAFSDRFIGIVNGLDGEVFDPMNDSLLPLQYDEHSFSAAKRAIKRALFQENGLASSNIQSDLFLCSFIGRVVEQKNIILIEESIRAIYKNTLNRAFMRFVLLGVGDEVLVQRLRALALEFPDCVVFYEKFDEMLAHRIFAASDIFIVPSRFEPCGLTQLAAMKYGTLPLATRVGGLADTIKENMTGFFIKTADPSFVSVQILDLYTIWINERDLWNEIVLQAMLSDFSWKESAKKYIEVYNKI